MSTHSKLLVQPVSQNLTELQFTNALDFGREM